MLRRSRRMVSLVGLSVAVMMSFGGLAAARATPANFDPVIRGSRQPERYSTTQSRTTRTTNQCALPLSQRTGGWSCDVTTSNAHLTRVHPDDLGNYCALSTCWDVSDSRGASPFKHTGQFGCGSSTIGQVTVYSQTTLAGPLLKAQYLRITPSVTLTSMMVLADTLAVDNPHTDRGQIIPNESSGTSTGSTVYAGTTSTALQVLLLPIDTSTIQECDLPMVVEEYLYRVRWSVVCLR